MKENLLPEHHRMRKISPSTKCPSIITVKIWLSNFPSIQALNVMKFHQNSIDALNMLGLLTLNSWKLKKLHTWLKTNGEYGFRPIGRRKNNIHLFRFQLEIPDLSGNKKTFGLPNKRFHRSIHKWNSRKFKMPGNLPDINSRQRRVNLYFPFGR